MRSVAEILQEEHELRMKARSGSSFPGEKSCPRVGTKYVPRGPKFTSAMCTEARNLYGQGLYQSEIAKRLGVSIATISRALNS